MLTCTTFKTVFHSLDSASGGLFPPDPLPPDNLTTALPPSSLNSPHGVATALHISLQVSILPLPSDHAWCTGDAYIKVNFPLIHSLCICISVGVFLSILIFQWIYFQIPIFQVDLFSNSHFSGGSIFKRLSILKAETKKKDLRNS